MDPRKIRLHLHMIQITKHLNVKLTPTLFHPNFWGCSRWTRLPMLGQARAGTFS